MCMSCSKSSRPVSGSGNKSAATKASSRRVVGGTNSYGQPKVRISFGNKSRSR